MTIDPEKKRKFNEYLDDILPEKAGGTHPAQRFLLHEIVRHPRWGIGIVTGYRLPDLEREFEGLGVQFVMEGRMTDHRVFTPKECRDLQGSGKIFDGQKHGRMTLEEVLNQA